MDEFHIHQPNLLRATFQPPPYAPNRVFTAMDLYLYYDLEHPRWYKRPDWFAVLGVSRLHEERDFRLSYVIWQERVVPYLAVELLSPGTEDEDCEATLAAAEGPPTKWEVYEQILGIPYYVTFRWSDNATRYFTLVHGVYREVVPTGQGLWLPEAEVGVGPWRGPHVGLERTWLRFYDARGVWLPTPEEAARQARQRAEQEHLQAKQERIRAEQEHLQVKQEHLRAERLAAQLRALGTDPAV